MTTYFDREFYCGPAISLFNNCEQDPGVSMEASRDFYKSVCNDFFMIGASSLVPKKHFTKLFFAGERNPFVPGWCTTDIKTVQVIDVDQLSEDLKYLTDYLRANTIFDRAAKRRDLIWKWVYVTFVLPVLKSTGGPIDY